MGLASCRVNDAHGQEGKVSCSPRGPFLRAGDDGATDLHSLGGDPDDPCPSGTYNCTESICNDIVYTGDDTVSNCGHSPCHHLYHTDGNLTSYTTISEYAQGGTGPGVCAFPSGENMVWAGSDASGHVYWGQYYGGSSVSGHTALPGTTRHSPSCTSSAVDGYLYVAFVGTDGRINVLRSTDGGATWPTDFITPETSSYGIAIASIYFGSTPRVVLAWAGTDSQHHINWGVFDPSCSNHSSCALSYKYSDPTNYTTADVSLTSQNICNGSGLTVAWKGATNADAYAKAYSALSGSNSCYWHWTGGDSQTGFAFTSLSYNGTTVFYFEAHGATNGGILEDRSETL